MAVECVIPGAARRRRWTLVGILIVPKPVSYLILYDTVMYI